MTNRMNNHEVSGRGVQYPVLYIFICACQNQNTHTFEWNMNIILK